MRRPGRHGAASGTDSSAGSAPAVEIVAPIGRTEELARLLVALDLAAAGCCRVAVVVGGAGVGKSSLVQHLRPAVDALGGRFVGGKFEQHNEREATAIMQALGELGRLLLSDSSEEERAQVRVKLLRSLGAQAGLARAVPQIALLLQDVPEPRPVDPAHAAARMVEVVLGLLRAVAAADRPLVLVLDDLQWSGTLSPRLVDAILGAADIEGLLLVVACRDDELPPGHPLLTALARWPEESDRIDVLPIRNLPVHDVAQLLGHLIGAPHAAPRELAELLAPHAAGNPYDTVEFATALRDAHLIGVADGEVWWLDAGVNDFLARTTVRDVLADRIARLAPPDRELLQSLACIGAHTRLEVARAASGLGGSEFDDAILALRQGELLLADTGDGVLRLRHDRVQQAAYSTLETRERPARHAALARRLALHPEFEAVAADQYECGVEEVVDPAECGRAARLLRAAAARARQIGNHVTAYRLQNAALSLLEAADRAGLGAGSSWLLGRCERDYHLALCSVGRLEEADAIYRRISARETDPLELAECACAQVASLTYRRRIDDALDIGMSVLHHLQGGVPEAVEPRGQVPDRLERIRRWVQSFELERESDRAETVEPWVAACAKLIGTLMSPAVRKSIDLVARLIFESHQLWEKHGPCAALLVCFSRAGGIAIALGQDWRTGYLAGRAALDLCEARAWEAEASQVRFLFVMSGIHWFEPLERRLREAERAREGLVARGDLRSASLSYCQSALCLFEMGPSLQRYSEELEGALTLSRRAGNADAIGACTRGRRLLGALRGELPYEELLQDQESFSCAIGCAIFGEGKGLARWGRVAQERGRIRRNVYGQSLYEAVWLYWLAGIGAAWELQSGAEAADAASQLSDAVEWLRRRAIDAPSNFGHLYLHLLAEQAWAAGDTDVAVRSFDDALAAVEETSRPWHHALIAERAGRLHRTLGWAHSAMSLLLEAQHAYADWGATAKAERLALETASSGNPGDLPMAASAAQRPAQGIDSLAVVRALQAFTAVRGVHGLKASVEEVLLRVTGATRAAVALWDEDTGDWERGPGRARLPLSVLRYAERTREPLLLADAVADDRFARDGYFQGMERCSLMVVPILHQAMMRAMLVLENRAGRGAFSTARLDAVMMIAGQLAVSLESAQLYERLEKKVQDQTQQLRQAQARLVDEARRAGMAQIATNVLHNVGNVLTSVNVSAHVLTERVRGSRAVRVGDLAALLESNASDLGNFFEAHEKGRMLPRYLRELAQALEEEREELLAELGRLGASVDHIKNVVAMQQSYAGATGVLQACSISELVEDALHIEQDSLQRSGVALVRGYEDVAPLAVDRTRVLQIVVTLLQNARESMESHEGKRQLTVGVAGADKGRVAVTVRDSGPGIAPEALEDIVASGFATGHARCGLLLHQSAVAARELGYELRVSSDSAGQGVTFALVLVAAAEAIPK